MKTNCGNKIKHTCADSNYATCISFEGTPNTESELAEEECLDIEATTQDLYDQVGEIKEELDLSELGDLCLDYVETEEGKIIVKNALLKFEEEICNLKTKIESLENRQICDIPIGECLEDFGCLEAPCEGTIVTLGDWMLAMQTRLCD